MLDKLRRKLSGSSPSASSTSASSSVPSPKAAPPPPSPRKGDDGAKRAYSGLRWGVTPSASRQQTTPATDIASLPPDHPVHQYSAEMMQKLRKKGINPISKAEMDDAMTKGGKRGFWAKNAFGGGWGLAI